MLEMEQQNADIDRQEETGISKGALEQNRARKQTALMSSGAWSRQSITTTPS